MVPIAAFPLFGIVNHKAMAASLGNHVIVLLMGAFMLSKAMEKSGVVKRLALVMLNAVGANSGKRLVLGFMLATAVLSMWISNTATTLMMMPIALAVMGQFEKNEQHTPQLKQALILGIAYAASLGGVGTLIGTPPNVIFAGIYQELTSQEFHFATWMTVGMPVVMIGIPIMAAWLTRNVGKTAGVNLPRIGAWRIEEIATMAIVVLTALAWMTRLAPWGGWSSWLGLKTVGDSTVVLIAVICLFLFPNGKGGRLLNWKYAQAIPWGTLILFAGGIALAKGLSEAGVVKQMALGLAHITNLPLYPMILILCLMVTFLTELTSNTATTTLLMPLLAAVASATDVTPAQLMIPAAMSASCAFMLPVATAPNAIAFGTGELTVKTMMREGVVLSVVMAFIIATVCYIRL